MRETGFSHVVITTSSAPQPGGFFAVLGWQVHSAALSADAADFWGADMTQVAERWLAPSGACEVVLLPVANTTAVLRPLDCAVTTPGGLFDINMRTWDSDWAREFLHTHGWRELVPAVAWQFGEVQTSEGLYIQDDGIVMAVMQRLSRQTVRRTGIRNGMAGRGGRMAVSKGACVPACAGARRRSGAT